MSLISQATKYVHEASFGIYRAVFTRYETVCKC